MGPSDKPARASAWFSISPEEMLVATHFTETSAGVARLLWDLETNRERRLAELQEAYDGLVEKLRDEVARYAPGDLGFTAPRGGSLE
jgi:hypothetical protein